MPERATVDEIVRLANELSPLDKLKVIERLAPELEAALTSVEDSAAASPDQDEQYQRGYEQVPEDTAELEALLPHLPLPTEQWE